MANKRRVVKTRKKGKNRLKRLKQDTKYNKAIKEIHSEITKAKESGYIIKESEIITKKKSKKLTKKLLKKLKRIDIQDIKDVSERIDFETGEIKAPKIKKGKAHKAKKSSTFPKTTTAGYQTISSIEELQRKISNLPDGRFFAGRKTVHYTSEKNIIQSMLQDRIELADKTNNRNKLAEYFLSVDDGLSESFTIIERSSQQEDVDQAFTRVLTLIKGSPLSVDEAQELEELIDYYDTAWNNPEEVD